MLCYRMEEWYSFDMEMWIRGSSIQDVVFQQRYYKKKYFFENSDRIQKRFSNIVSETQIKQYNKEKRINIKII